MTTEFSLFSGDFSIFMQMPVNNFRRVLEGGIVVVHIFIFFWLSRHKKSKRPFKFFECLIPYPKTLILFAQFIKYAKNQERFCTVDVSSHLALVCCSHFFILLSFIMSLTSTTVALLFLCFRSKHCLRNIMVISKLYP